MTAELNHPPFDLTEGEQELVGGFHTEYSSVRFAMFYLAEFMNMITMSAVMVTLFFGGPDGPGFHFVRWLWPILWFAGKTLVFISVYVWVRAALPRLRYDQLMELGWKVLIPLSFGWLLVVSAFRVGTVWGIGVFVGFAVVAGALWKAVLVARSAAGAGEARPRRRPTTAIPSCGPCESPTEVDDGESPEKIRSGSSVVSPRP